AEDLYSYKLIHVTGTTKLLELPIEEKHVPNIFLHAAMVSDAELYEDTKQVVVPPVQQFLSVEVKADREQYQPREEGTLSILAKDANGKPVSAEIALAMFDESVKYIQQDYAGDPRQFYYGTKRAHSVETESTFGQKPYLRLVEVAKGRLVDSREAAQTEDDENIKEVPAGGAGSGRYVIDGVASADMPAANAAEFGATRGALYKTAPSVARSGIRDASGGK